MELGIEDWKKYSQLIPADLDPEFEDIEEDLDEFIIFNWGKFVIIHGFPGDNPQCFIFEDDSFLFGFSEIDKEYDGSNNDIKQFQKWYIKETKDMTDYSSFQLNIIE